MIKEVKHKIRDGIIWCIDVLGGTAIYRKFVKRNRPLVRVIGFHDVEDGVWFKTVIDGLASKYHILTPEEFEKRAFDKEKINLLLTFDDGYESWITNVLPALGEKNIKGLFFVCSGLLDVAEDAQKASAFMESRLRISPKNPLTWSGVTELSRSGHTIGGHTKNHKILSLLNKAECKEEIFEDKETIESRTGSAPTYFAYPFGRKTHYNDQVKNVVNMAGYTHAFTAETGLVSPQGDRYALPRTLIEKNQSLFSIHRWIRGAYDVLSCAKFK